MENHGADLQPARRLVRMFCPAVLLKPLSETFVRSILFAGLSLLIVSSAVGQEYKTGIEWDEPRVVTPGAANSEAPSDALVLFDGSNLDEWNGKWKIEDGHAIPNQGSMRTKRSFGDIQLHVEWSAPTEIRGKGQGRGNSGIYLMDRYEVQVLDSFENATYFDGQAASIYKQTPPMVNAMRKPGEWNTYDIFFTAPKFDVNGGVKQPAYVTVVHNGILVLNHYQLRGATSFVGPAEYSVHDPQAPISLQDHGNPVRFRNIWVREIKEPTGRRTSAPYVLKRGERVDPKAAADQEEEARFQRAVKAAVQQELKKRAAAAAQAAEANSAPPVTNEAPKPE